MNKLFSFFATLFLFATTVGAQTVSGGDYSLPKFQSEASAPATGSIAELAAKYSQSCVRAGQLHKCGEGQLAAIFEGKVVCRPSFKDFPFAKQGETPCTSDPYSGIVVK